MSLSEKATIGLLVHTYILHARCCWWIKTDILNEYLNNFDYFSFDLPPRHIEGDRMLAFYSISYDSCVYLSCHSNVAYYYYFCYEEGLSCTLMCVCVWVVGEFREGWVKPLSFAQKHTINFHLNVVPTYICCERVHKASSNGGGGGVKGSECNFIAQQHSVRAFT